MDDPKPDLDALEADIRAAHARCVSMVFADITVLGLIARVRAAERKADALAAELAEERALAYEASNG